MFLPDACDLLLLCIALEEGNACIQQCIHLPARRTFQATLPNGQDSPTQGLQCLTGSGIATAVGVDLCDPEFRARGGQLE